MTAQKEFARYLRCLSDVALLKKQLATEGAYVQAKLRGDAAGSNCFQCGHPLGGVATALCIECFEEQQKEKKDCDFKFAEWD